MKKLLVLVSILGLVSCANAYINSPMELVWNQNNNTIGINMPEGMAYGIDELSGGYWAIIGVDPTSGNLNTDHPDIPEVMDLSGIGGDASQTGLFVADIGVFGEFVCSFIGTWDAEAGIYAENFTVLPSWTSVYLFKINDEATEATWIPQWLDQEPPPSWIFVPEPTTITLLCLGGLMLRRKK